eukprot:gene9807-6883_t
MVTGKVGRANSIHSRVKWIIPQYCRQKASNGVSQLHLLPRSARHARLFRLARKIKESPFDEMGDGERLAWVNSHIKSQQDRELSRIEENLRERQIPLQIGENSFVANNQASHGNLFHFREYPMYPGEYVPPEHNTLSSLKDELKMDLTTQSIKNAWMRVSGGMIFKSLEDYYSSGDGLDHEQVGEIVWATLPGLTKFEAQALVTRIIESFSSKSDSTHRRLCRSITADAIGLRDAPEHYANFLEWMGKMTETRAFKTEHALFEFSRRKFNKDDVQVMFENYNLLSKTTIQSDRADSYSHFYAVLRDFSRKISGEDTRHQIGVRIDPPEVDIETGIAIGEGCADGFKYRFTALIRENRNRTGVVYVMGKPLSVAFDDKSWLMEMILMPFDEAKLEYHDFDVNIISEGKAMPSIANEIAAFGCRMAVANAISKLLPVTRIPLKKAGLLSVDRRREPGQFPGFFPCDAENSPGIKQTKLSKFVLTKNIKKDTQHYPFPQPQQNLILADLGGEKDKPFRIFFFLEMPLLMLIAALLWGLTNPLLKHFSKGMQTKGSVIEDIGFLFSKPKYLLTQICNLLGSVVFFYGLRDVDVSVGSIVANSLAFVITAITSTLVLKEEPLNRTAGVGL